MVPGMFSDAMSGLFLSFMTRAVKQSAGIRSCQRDLMWFLDGRKERKKESYFTVSDNEQFF